MQRVSRHDSGSIYFGLAQEEKRQDWSLIAILELSAILIDNIIRLSEILMAADVVIPGCKTRVIIANRKSVVSEN